MQPIHYFVLRHHLEHKDSDRNAGFAAVAAGLTLDWEHGRRASRSIREDLNWIEQMLDDDGQPAVVKNYGTNKFAARNRIRRGRQRRFDGSIHSACAMKIPDKRRNKFFLDSHGRYTPKLDPEIPNAATQVERNRIAALIELQEGPGRHL